MPSAAALAQVEALEALHARAVGALRAALAAYLADGTRPDPAARAAGAFCYPELRLRYHGAPAAAGAAGRAYGRLYSPGDYATSITQPALFRDYLAEQIDLLVADFGATVEVGASDQEIPYPYVLDAELDLTGAAAADLAQVFPSTDLRHIGDEIADGTARAEPGRPRPLALFEAARVDFSLARLRHYLGTPPGDVQRFILFTNYHRYVDEFVSWAVRELDGPGGYTMLSGAGGLCIRPGDPDPAAAVADSPPTTWSTPIAAASRWSTSAWGRPTPRR